MRTGALWRVAALALLAALIGPLPRAAATDAAAQGTTMTITVPERAVKVIRFKAPGAGKRPSVLLLHGAGGFRRVEAYEGYARTLTAAGMDAYLVYYYSPGDMAAMAQGRQVFEQRFPAWAKLVGDLADTIAKLPDASGKVALIGFSNGAILSVGAAALDPNIAADVVYYGALPWPLGKPVTHLPPLLVLHGAADQIIPVEAGEQVAATARKLGTPVEMKIYPGEGHGFGARDGNPNSADAHKRTLAFLRKELLAP